MAIADPHRAFRQIEDMLRRGQLREADAASTAATQQWPREAEAWILAARTRLALGRAAPALEAAQQALTLAPDNHLIQLLKAEALISNGSAAQGAALLDTVGVGHSVPVDQKLGQLYTLANRHDAAARAHRSALTREPDNIASLANLAASEIALGDMAAAGRLFDRVIALDSSNSDAYYNRATLRRQTPDTNHVAELERALAAGHHPMDAVLLNYALAKELEDLGEHDRSFAALKAGADGRRAMLSYRVEDDIETMEMIASTLDASICQKGGGDAGPRPVFVLGLPRSGTTLVDRILSSHSLVESAGETTAFALALVELAGPVKSKLDLVKRAAELDFAALGRNYAKRVGAGGSVRIVDKTPANYLYLGLIARALPNAAIVHVTRDPMDSCYAIYKTLFRMAYPFSYDLSDLARYYGAYSRLMEHWRAAVPGRFLEISYEALIADQEGVTRRLLAHCCLDWEDACLRFEQNPSPSLTASAAQIRQPLYNSSVGLWRRYEEQLAPLARALAAQGIVSHT